MRRLLRKRNKKEKRLKRTSRSTVLDRLGYIVTPLDNDDTEEVIILRVKRLHKRFVFLRAKGMKKSVNAYFIGLIEKEMGIRWMS